MPVFPKYTTVDLKDNQLSHEPFFGFFYLGFCQHLASCFVFQQVAYFNSVLGGSFGTLLNICLCLADNLGLALMVRFGSGLNFRTRIAFSAICSTFLLVALPYVAASGFRFKIGYALCFVMLMGVCGSVFHGTVSGLTGLCSEKARSFQNLGASLPGTLAWPVMLVVNTFFSMIGWTRSSIDEVTTYGGLILAAVVLCCVIPYYVLYFERTRAVQVALANKEIVADDDSSNGPRSKGSIILSTLPLAVAAWAVTFLSYIVIPDQVLEWKSEKYAHLYPGGDLAVQDMHIYVFQLFDTLGRFSIILKPDMFGPVSTMIGAWSRLLLLPLFYLSSGNVSFFGFDFFRLILNSTWGFSSGVFISLACNQGPNQVASNEGDIAGQTMSFAAENGVLMGSAVALAIRHIGNLVSNWTKNRQECLIGKNFTLVCVPNHNI